MQCKQRSAEKRLYVQFKVAQEANAAEVFIYRFLFCFYQQVTGFTLKCVVCTYVYLDRLFDIAK